MTKIVGPLVALMLAPAVAAQPPAGAPPVALEDALDPSPIDKATDPNIDLFVGDYRNATPRTEFGGLTYYDILTPNRGDMQRPTAKGAVLSVMTAVSRAVLDPGATAGGRMASRQREAMIAVEGSGTITVRGKSYPVASGAYFQVTPDVDFKLTNTGRVPLVFYVRTEPLPASYKIPAFAVFNRFDNDRVFGAHWSHSCDMVADGSGKKVFPPMTFCAMSPYSMPQPHSHPGEEVWLQVEGQSIVSVGKNVLPLEPGQAYRIPPNGLATHSNMNLTDRMTKILYLGPIDRPAENVTILARGIPLVQNYSRLDNRAIDPPKEEDVEMYIANWRDVFPQIRHGNMYIRELLTGLTGPDALHPIRTGAVLSNAATVSYGMLEPGSKAHAVPGEAPGVQEIFVVNSGDGMITSGGKSYALSRDKAFIAPPGLEYTITAGNDYMTFYIVGEKLAAGAAPKAGLTVIDHRSDPAKVADWVDSERTVVGQADGLGQYASVTRVDMPASMAMSRPTSAMPGGEEIWIATDGDIDMLFGKRLRKLPSGTAYRVPPTGITATAHINTTGKPASFLRVLK